METLNELELGKACDLLCERTNNNICGGTYGGFWLYRRLRDYFCGETAAVSVEIPCVYFFDNGEHHNGTATIHRNGQMECRLTHDAPTGKGGAETHQYWIINRDNGMISGFDSYKDMKALICSLKDCYVVKVYGYGSRYAEFWTPAENEIPHVIMP